MSLDKLEAFIEFAQHLEKEHDIPFTKSHVSDELPIGRNSRPVHILRKDYGDSYPHTICEYDQEDGIFYYKLVGDNKYYYRLKKNDDAVDNKDTLTSLKDKCAPIIEALYAYIDFNQEISPYSSTDARYDLHKLKEMINTTDKE